MVSFADEAAREALVGEPVKAAFRLLADTGFGGERSRGWGRSEAPEFTEGMLPDLILPLSTESAAASAEPVEVFDSPRWSRLPLWNLWWWSLRLEPEPPGWAQRRNLSSDRGCAQSRRLRLEPSKEPEPPGSNLAKFVEAAVFAPPSVEPLVVEPSEPEPPADTTPEPEPEPGAPLCRLRRPPPGRACGRAVAETVTWCRSGTRRGDCSGSRSWPRARRRA